jgi:hypothetical protein
MTQTEAPPPHVQLSVTKRIFDPSGDQCGFVFVPVVVSGALTVPLATSTV